MACLADDLGIDEAEMAAGGAGELEQHGGCSEFRRGESTVTVRRSRRRGGPKGKAAPVAPGGKVLGAR